MLGGVDLPGSYCESPRADKAKESITPSFDVIDLLQQQAKGRSATDETRDSSASLE